jgi:anaerobic selenocysteine-containing dehydrogenase
MNSARYEQAERRGTEQPWVRCNPDDVARLDLADGDAVVLTNVHGTTAGVLRVDDRVRPGVVSLTHGWVATNPTALTSVVDEVDPLTGMICQSAIPVTLAPAPT